MDALAGIAKITGVVLLVWTAYSIFKHFTHRSIKAIMCPGAVKNGAVLQGNSSLKGEKKYSLTEHFLNNLLLYLWFIFLLSFSIGLIANN